MSLATLHDMDVVRGDITLVLWQRHMNVSGGIVQHVFEAPGMSHEFAQGAQNVAGDVARHALRLRRCHGTLPRAPESCAL